MGSIGELFIKCAGPAGRTGESPWRGRSEVRAASSGVTTVVGGPQCQLVFTTTQSQSQVVSARAVGLNRRIYPPFSLGSLSTRLSGTNCCFADEATMHTADGSNSLATRLRAVNANRCDTPASRLCRSVQGWRPENRSGP